MQITHKATQFQLLNDWTGTGILDSTCVHKEWYLVQNKSPNKSANSMELLLNWKIIETSYKYFRLGVTLTAQESSSRSLSMQGMAGGSEPAEDDGS